MSAREPAPRPILFLDVDGVLHPLRMEVKDGKVVDDHCFQSNCCRELVRIVEATGAELVITSTWRQFDLPRQRLRDGLARYGLSFTRWVTLGPLPGGRAGQILDFVQREGVGDVSWAVVDDEAVVGDSEESMMMRLLSSRFVRTNPDTGMTSADADKLISILTASSDEDSEL